MSRAPRALGSTVHALIVGFLVACLVGVAGWTVGSISRLHGQLVALAAEERASQLEAAALRVSEELEDVTLDLAFALTLVGPAGDPAAARQSLAALVGSVRPYRMAALYDGGCAEIVVVRDPRWSGEAPPELDAALAAAAAAACRQGPGQVMVSPPIGDGELERYRTFARARGGATVALVVDTDPLLEALRLVAADASADVVVVGPHGNPAQLSADRLLRGVAGGRAPALARVVDAMRSGQGGTAVIPAEEAVGLGYPDADLLVVHRRIPAAPWSAAVAVSTAGLRSHERALAVRLGASGLAGTALLVALAAYVVRVGRGEAAAAERLRTADEVAHLRYRAERILDHLPVGVVALGAGERVTAVNGAARRWAGEALDPTLEALLPGASPAALGQLRELVGGARASGRVHGLVAAPLALFGREGTWTVHAVPVVPPTAEVQVVLVVEDLTELRNLQDQLLRAEKLGTVGVLAAGIAHEIGTPLGVIRGRAELVERKLGPGHPQSASLKVVVEQIDRITRTIRALLDFADPRPVVAGAVPPGGPIDRVAELVRYEAEKRRVRLVTSVDPQLPAIQGDADQLQQVLVNLVMNALDACGEGGTIEIAAAAAACADGTPGVALRVTDTGRGIPAADLHRVFDPFFTTRKRGQGTGLGLAIVNRIARDHGGEVRVSSTVGKGTTVEVLFPFDPAGLGPAIRAWRENPAGGVPVPTSPPRADGRSA